MLWSSALQTRFLNLNVFYWDIWTLFLWSTINNAKSTSQVVSVWVGFWGIRPGNLEHLCEMGRAAARLSVKSKIDRVTQARS